MEREFVDASLVKMIIKNIKNLPISVVQTENKDEEEKLYNNNLLENLMRQNGLGIKEGRSPHGLEVIFYSLFIQLFNNYNQKKTDEKTKEENDYIKSDIDFIIKQSIINLNSKSNDKINTEDKYIRTFRLNAIEEPLKKLDNKLDVLKSILYDTRCDDNFSFEVCSKFIKENPPTTPSTSQIIDDNLKTRTDNIKRELKRINDEADKIYSPMNCDEFKNSSDAVSNCINANKKKNNDKQEYIKRNRCNYFSTLEDKTYFNKENCLTTGGKSRKYIAPLHISNLHRSKHSRISLRSNRRSYRSNKCRSKKTKKTKRHLRH